MSPRFVRLRFVRFEAGGKLNQLRQDEVGAEMSGAMVISPQAERPLVPREESRPAACLRRGPDVLEHVVADIQSLARANSGRLPERIEDRFVDAH